MQVVNKIISRANSDYFGELVCMADEAGSPCFWAIKKKMSILNVVDEDIIIALNLYCYDRKFVTQYSESRTEKINNDVKETYDIFLQDSLFLNDFFVQEFNSEKIDWDIETIVDNLNDIRNNIKLVRIEILKNCYNIVFLLNDEEWVLEKSVKNNAWSLLPSGEAPYPEMEYK
jgi:hypothetical protein